MAKIFVYAENCVMAGYQVPQRVVGERNGESDDFIAVELSEEEAAWYEKNKGLYGARVAQTIRESLN